MAIIKSKHASNYTVIPNEVFNSGLSVGAIGLLTYFLNLPHDWIIYKTTVHEKLGIGREKLDRYFKELVNNGYIISVHKHMDNGKFEYEHIVYDKPFNGEPQTAKPLTEKPYTAKPQTVNPQLLNTNLQSKHKQSKEIQSKNIQIPAWIDFLEYATSKKPTVCEQTLKLKYDSWVENNWVNGNGVKIKNWKSALLNTLPYIKDGSNSNNTKMVY